MQTASNMKINYFVDKKSLDIYKSIQWGDRIIGYVKYRNVKHATPRHNKDGYYEALEYPFSSYLLARNEELTYSEQFGTFLPQIKAAAVLEINRHDILVERFQENSSPQFALIREMFQQFEKEVPGFAISKMGLDASLQCGLETQVSDIDLVTNDGNLYKSLYAFVSKSADFEQFIHGLIERRGSYSTLLLTEELEFFERRKISFTFKGTKVSILYSDDSVVVPESLAPTGRFLFLKSEFQQDVSVGEPSLLDLDNYTVLYGPDLEKRPLSYLSAIPVRTGFILNAGDVLLITGMVYRGLTTGKFYICQFPWDYCQIFKTHNIALNTYLQVGNTDKRVMAKFFNNLRL